MFTEDFTKEPGAVPVTPAPQEPDLVLFEAFNISSHSALRKNALPVLNNLRSRYTVLIREKRDVTDVRHL
jgi:hypothetical protein